MEVIANRVIQEVDRADLETVLLRQIEIKNQIDKKAYHLYKIEELDKTQSLGSNTIRTTQKICANLS
ncbi:MAG: hypothetical protein ACLBM1_07570 [Cuspidothrix sp.]|uniref:Uncharacterized protein n=1 Tax=Cuspidothrix issatschenkoi CHARLIE-1 TaxID=2052836 RepID=A0A2S6CY61_9CYAN|nr:hypothetical protein [Cuspidothrix issatschenkoi]PPJ64704.1 hypothetical protein CUN59_03450 [Cuspidothrix issatschenkoi CHARLIE-1]